MTYLSLCMIVKNEESVLKRCLDSVKGIVDEIVIADTGSTDNTVKIASEYTKHIYKYEWTDSFSEARNFVQKKAKGKWILVLDADEFVDRDNLIAVKNKLLENTVNIDVFFTEIYNFTGKNGEYIVQHKAVRIYKNHTSIKFTRTIHEQLVHEDRELKSDISDLIIYHSGYLKNTVKNKDKNTRNTQLIKKQTEKMGKMGFDYFNRGNEFLLSQEFEKALECYQQAYLSQKDISLEWVPINAVQTILCLIALKRFKEALLVIDEGERLWKKAPDFKYLKGQVFLDQNRLEDAKEQLTSLIVNKNKYNTFIKSVDFLELYPYMLLGYIYEKENNNNKAIMSYTHVLSANKESYQALYKLMSILIKYCSQEEILKFIESQKLSDEKNILRMIEILLNLFQCELAEIFINQLDNKLKIMEGILLKLMMLKGEYPQAIEYLNSLSDEDLNRVLNEEFFDWADLFLLYIVKKDPIIFSRIEKGLDDESIIDFLQNGNIKSEADKNIYVTLLERSIKYHWFDLFESMLSKKKYFDSSLDLEIGHLLCRYNFNELALNFYENVGDIGLLDETAFVNIIDALIKLNDKENALKYSLQAIELGYTDFRIFKFTIELLIELNEKDSVDEIIQLALKHYTDSNWLKNVR